MNTNTTKCTGPTFCQRGTSLSEISKRNQRVMNKTTKKPIHRIHFLFFYSQKFQTKKFRYTFNRKNVFGMDARKKLSTEISRRGTDSSQENICSYENCIKKSLVHGNCHKQETVGKENLKF